MGGQWRFCSFGSRCNVSAFMMVARLASGRTFYAMCGWAFGAMPYARDVRTVDVAKSMFRGKSVGE